MKELEFHPYANLFPLIEGQAFKDLVADIKANRMAEPIVLFEGKILDGRNRYRAGREGGVLRPDGYTLDLEFQAGPTLREFRPESEGDPLQWVISRNLHRRHLDETQRAMVAARLANLGHGGKRTPAEEQAADRPVDAEPAPVTQAAAAALLNSSERSVRRARVVVDQGAPELVAKADAGTIAVSVAAELAKLPVDDQREVLRSADPGALYRVIKDQRDALTAQKKTKRLEKVKALGARQRALPAKKYGVIYADPEWDHETWSEAGKGRAAANHYPVSTTAVIKSRPVGEIAADDCVLFLWVTVPHLAQGLDVMAAWGFAYKSSCVWEKEYPGKQQGMGYWFRVNHEILLVGTRGNIPAPALGTQWGSVIKAPTAAHSEKPEIFATLIDVYFGDLPKIELNARKARPGWDAWGLEAPEAEAEPAPAKPAKAKAKTKGQSIFAVETERDRERIAKRLALLPSDLDELCEAYKAALSAYDDRMSIGDAEQGAMHLETMEAILLKANGGERMGIAVNERPLAVKAAAAAPLGQLPKWGQTGRFEFAHRDVRAIVEIGERGCSVYAVDLNRPFPSQTGYRSVLSIGRLPGQSIDDYARAIMDAAIDYRSDGPKAKPAPLVVPWKAYRLQLDRAGQLVARERGIWVDRSAPPLGFDAGLIEGCDVIRARWDAEEQARVYGSRSKGRTCPISQHGSDKIIAINGQRLTPVADFPSEGAYAVTASQWVDGKRVEGWRYVDEAAFHDRELPPPAEDEAEDIPAFLRRERCTETTDLLEGEGEACAS